MALRRILGFDRVQRTVNDLRTKRVEFIDKVKNFETPERFKDTFVERWGKFWKNVYLDYQEVAVDVAKNCKTHPVRASFKATGGAYYLVKNNPDEVSFRQELLTNTMRVIPVGQSVRNPNAVERIKFLERCYAENLVRRLNLGILSLVWIDDYDSECANYRATCTYLRPRYVTFHRRIVDVGLLNTWWIWEDKMRDYDVNESEFKSLDT